MRLDAAISAELLVTIFWPNTPLHDGAAILPRRARLLPPAACCRWPRRIWVIPKWHASPCRRGVPEQTDAMSLVVSEETGNISVARNGRIARVEAGQLRRILTEFYRPATITEPEA